MQGNGHLPYWIFYIKEPVLKENTASLYHVLRDVDKRNYNYNITRSEGDLADLEGAKEDLRNVMLDIYEQRNGDNTWNNPLWAAIMQIRPKVIDGTLSTFYSRALADVLWQWLKESQQNRPEERDEECEDFCRKLAVRTAGRVINFYRAVISGGSRGGPFQEKRSGSGSEDGWVAHYFPGIPRDIMREAGVRLTIRSENLEAVKTAYKKMCEHAQGPAKDALLFHLQDIEDIANRIFRPQMN